MKRVLLILFSPTLILLSIYFIWIAKLNPFLNEYITETLNTAQFNKNITIKVKESELDLFPPQLTLQQSDLKVKTSPDSQQTIQIEKIQLQAHLIKLLLGQIRNLELEISNITTLINLDNLQQGTEPKPLPLEQFFEQINFIPIEKININNLKLSIESSKNKISIDSHLRQLQLEFLKNTINSTAKINKINFIHSGKNIYSGNLDLIYQIKPNLLTVQNLSTDFNKSNIQGNLQLKDLKNIFISPIIQFNLYTHVYLDDVESVIKNMNIVSRAPALAGRLNAQINGEFENFKLKGGITGQTENIQIDQFKFGNVKVIADLKNSIITFPSLNFEHPAGIINLSKTNFNIETTELDTEISSNDIQLSNLFKSLNLENIPVDMKLEPQLKCQGNFKSIEFQCDANVMATKLWVRSQLKDPNSEIIALDSLGAFGKVFINKNEIKFNSKAKIKNSEGLVDGVIDFNKGFLINYRTQNLDFANVKNLSHLNLKGQFFMEGSTSGDSQTAIFNINIKSQKTSIDRFYLGNLSTQLNYEKGVLYFNKINGDLPKTLYNGDLVIDLHNLQLSGKIKFPQTDLSDIKEILKDFYLIPLDIEGSGFANIDFQGPLDFWKLNTHLKGQFNQIIASGENFDKLLIDIQGDDGILKLNILEAKKNKSTINLKGQIDSPEKIDLRLEAKNWKLEESENISKFTQSLIGDLNLKALIKGSVTDTQLTLDGTLKNIIVSDQEVADSQFLVDSNNKELNLKANLFNDNLKIQYTKNFQSDSQTQIKIQSNNWDFTTILGLFGFGELQNEYRSTLNADINMNIPNSNWKSIDGEVRIDKFYIQRGTLSLSNPKQMKFKATNGALSFQNFRLVNENNFLELSGNQWGFDNLNFKIDGKAELRLLHLFLPFLEDLSGEVSFQTSFSKSYDKPQIIGNTQLKNTFIKIKGFPHPLEEVRSEIIFSQSKIEIPSITGNMAGGLLSGDGQIEIQGIRNTPLKINIQVDQTSLRFPENVISQGNIKLELIGSWFPFELRGDYDMRSAQFLKEFTEESTEVTLQKSNLLKNRALELDSFEPLSLQIKLKLPKQVFVKNNLMNGDISGQLEVIGFVSNPILLGKININKSSQLIIKDKSFEVINGTVTFSNLVEINPDIYLTAQARFNEYDVQLLAQGPAKNLVFKFTSQPSLPENDIISLLALGVTSSVADQTNTNQLQEQTSFEIGNALLAQTGFVKKLKNELNVDVQFSPVYDSTGNIANRKITFSRKLTEKIKGSFSQNLGEQNNNFKVEYLFSPNTSIVGSWETKDPNSQFSSITSENNKSILGVDLEFKKEFK